MRGHWGFGAAVVAVRYSALSNSNDTVKSAVVVDLEFAPDQVYVEISLAR